MISRLPFRINQCMSPEELLREARLDGCGVVILYDPTCGLFRAWTVPWLPKGRHVRLAVTCSTGMLHMVRDLRDMRPDKERTQFYHESAYLEHNTGQAIGLTWQAFSELRKERSAEALSHSINQRVRVCVLERGDIPLGGTAAGAGVSAVEALDDLMRAYANSIAVATDDEVTP